MMYRSLLVVVFYELVAGSPSPNICTTPACLNFVNSLKNSMNTTINPCDDFYEFTCGQWSKNNPIPSGRMIWSRMEEMHKDVMKKIIDMLNDDLDKTPTTEAYQKVRKMYRNCMDLETIEKNGVEAILAQLRSTGGWPVMMPLNDWTSNETSLSQLHLYHVREFNLAPLYAFKVRPSVGNSSAYIWTDVTSSTPFKKILKNHPPMSSEGMHYADKIIAVVNILANATGNIVNAADVLNDVTDMIDFEWALTKLISTPKNSLDMEYLTFKGLKNLYNNSNISSLILSESDDPRIILLDILSSIFQDTGINSTDDTRMIYWNFQRLEQLTEILGKASKRTIVNYMQWVFITKVLIAAPEKLRNILDELIKLKTGGKAPKERNETCFQLLGFQHAISYEFVKHHFPVDTITKVNAIITEISEAFHRILNQTSWLKTDEQQNLHDKLSSIIRLIGYPEWYNDSANIDNYYLECNISDTFLENINIVNQFLYKRNLLLLSSSNPKHERFRISPVKIQAVYDIETNTIVLPAALLQGPIFSSDDPLFFQYAGVGNIAGHEIAHAIDWINWWSYETKVTFTYKADCFVWQYNNYVVYEDENMTINTAGDFTLNENIADLHGLKAAYGAYQNIKTREDENLRLPGLESYDDRQLFFLAHTALHCSVADAAYYKNVASKDPHSIIKWRIIGSLSNMEEFSAAFNCPDTAKMNPQAKCGIWGTDN